MTRYRRQVTHKDRRYRSKYCARNPILADHRNLFEFPTCEDAGRGEKLCAVWAGAKASLWEIGGLITVIETVTKPASELRAIGGLS